MKKDLFLKLILFSLLIISIVRYYNEQDVELSQTSLSITLITVLGGLIIYKLFLRNEKFLNNNYLTISTLFITGFILVHFFDYLAFILGINDSIIDINLVDSRIVNEAAICSLCVFVAYILGYSSYSISFKRNDIRNNYETGNILEIFFLLFVLSFYIYMPQQYFNGGYGELMNSGGIPTTAYLSQVFLQACQLGNSINKIYKFSNIKQITFTKYIKSYSSYYYLSLVFYFILVMSSGDRGPLMTMSLVYIIPFMVINNKKMTLKYTLICLFLAVISLNMLGTLRQMDGDLSITKLQEAQNLREERYEDQNKLFTSVAELSNVVRSYHAVYGFHDNTSSLYGMGILNQFLSFIPGLRFFLYPALGVNENILSSSFIATLELGKNHGMGTTCLADTYLNLGFIGSIIFFYIFGMIIKRMDYTLYKRRDSLFILVLSIAYLSNGIYMGRATCFAPINVAIYAYIFVLLASKFYKKEETN